MRHTPPDISKVRLFQYEEDYSDKRGRLFQSETDGRPSDYSRKSRAFETDGVLKKELEEIRELLNNSGEAYKVILAVEHGDFRTLVQFINDLIRLNQITKSSLDHTQGELKKARDEVELLKKGLEGKMIPPALKKALDTEEMKLLYDKYKSFSKVAQLMGCDRKTVKNRLKREGYILDKLPGV